MGVRRGAQTLRCAPRRLDYGAPPHGWIGPGIDRLIMTLAGTANPRGAGVPKPRLDRPMLYAPAAVTRTARGARLRGWPSRRLRISHRGASLPYGLVYLDRPPQPPSTPMSPRLCRLSFVKLNGTRQHSRRAARARCRRRPATRRCGDTAERTRSLHCGGTEADTCTRCSLNDGRERDGL